jgi:hypothetical protein
MDGPNRFWRSRQMAFLAILPVVVSTLVK